MLNYIPDLNFTDWCGYWIIIGCKGCYWACLGICHKHSSWPGNFNRGLFLSTCYLNIPILSQRLLVFGCGIIVASVLLTYELLMGVSVLSQFIKQPWLTAYLIILYVITLECFSLITKMSLYMNKIVEKMYIPRFFLINLWTTILFIDLGLYIQGNKT